MKDAGYFVEEKSAYHWHVTKRGNKLILNVWPSVRKYMIQYSSIAMYYSELLKTVDSIFSDPKNQIPEKPSYKEHLDEGISEMRKGGLDYFKSRLINKNEN